MPRALKTVAWASSPAITVISGAPYSPSFSTSQPAAPRSARRAAARQVKLAMVAPVTKAPPQASSRSRSSRNHRRDTISRAEPTGDPAHSPVFWSQAPASQLAASVAGSVPPMTKPKNLPPAEATVAGEPRRSSCSSIVSGSQPFCGRGTSNLSRLATASGAGATGRLSRVSRNRMPRRAADRSISMNSLHHCGLGPLGEE
jgi:hypothetical protein